MVGIAKQVQVKPYCMLLPLLQELSYSNQSNPRILILVPTRSLVTQVVQSIESLTEYISCRIIGVYGGTNINTQKILLQDGADIVVSTPGRLYDLGLCKALQLKGVSN